MSPRGLRRRILSKVSQVTLDNAPESWRLPKEVSTYGEGEKAMGLGSRQTFQGS